MLERDGSVLNCLMPRTFAAFAIVAMSLGVLLSSATPAAAQSGCASRAANTIYWGDGYEAQVLPGDGLNLRAGPGISCSIIDALSYGDPLVVVGDSIWHDGYEWAPVSTYLGDGFVWAAELGAPGSVVGATRVPVLMYHRINDAPAEYEVTVDRLYQQMDWLASNGYTSVTPSDLLAAIDSGVPLPPKPVMLTVDDGFVSTMTFASVFAEYGFRGSYFLPNEATWRLTDGDIAYLAQIGEVCGHTVDHADLSSLSVDGQWYEVSANKTWLEGIIGAPISCFAYPYGAYDGATTDIVAGSGYAIAFDAWDGAADITTLNRYHIPRIEVSGFMSLDEFAASL
jgi:peptidoglycan/xylan/chitin deacetylase (PgdA/CDA1 family)